MGSYRLGVYRFLLTRRWLGLLAAALSLAVGCVLMGLWQVDRMQDRHARNDLLERNLSRPVAPIGEVMSPRRAPDEAMQYARIGVSGRYDPARTLLVRLRPFEGQVGYYVVVPLVTDDGSAVLVNRGWVPQGPRAPEPPDVPAPPTSEVSVVARVRVSEPRAEGAAPPPGQVTRIDVPTIARDLPYPLHRGYGDLVAERPRPGEAPLPLPAPEPTEGPHLAYAFQWFLFAALALGGYAILARREAADRRQVA